VSFSSLKLPPFSMRGDSEIVGTVSVSKFLMGASRIFDVRCSSRVQIHPRNQTLEHVFECVRVRDQSAVPDLPVAKAPATHSVHPR